VRAVSPAFRALMAACLAGAWASFGAPAAGAPDAGVPLLLTAAAQVRGLDAAEADRGLPVRLRAVITFAAESHRFLFVQDATDGIFVDASGVPPQALAAAAARQVAIIEGESASGAFAPQVRLRRLTIVGPGAWPRAEAATYPELASGKLDSRLVTVRGMVRSIGREPPRPDGQVRFILELATGGVSFQVRLHLADPGAAADLEGDKLIDATVGLRGVCGGIFNGQRQLVGVVLHAPDAGAVTVLEPPSTSDPFATPPQPIESLFRFSPRGRSLHRVHVDGTVVYRQAGGALYVADDSSGLAVQTRQEGALVPGDRIQVVGFPAMGEWTPVLEDATFRRIGTATAPPPVPTTADKEASADAHDARLVTLDAELLDVAEQRGHLVLALRAGGAIFDADVAPALTAEPAAEALQLSRGSRLTLTGVSVARVDKLLKRPTAFKLLLRGPADVVVRARPSWWTLGRLLGLLTALGAIFALVVIWVLILRRRVRDQTEIIRRQLQHEAALEERYRDLFENANDIVFSQDVDGRLTAVNRAAEQISGFRRAELMTRTLLDLMPAERRETARRLFQRVLAGEEEPPAFETAIVARDGRVIPLEVTVRLTLQKGRPAGIEGIARDVSSRKRAEADLAVANQRLLDVSRRAGMAEVASSVLHNVGNVLNTVNVSAALLADRLRASRAPNLARAVALLREHEADLAAFLQGDPQGQALVAYLAGVAEHMVGEQTLLLEEVGALGNSVDHIKEIVAMQQGYARATGGVEETLPASALLADAVRMHAESLSRHQIELEREVADDPEVTVEKHKVLQILVNLISNAKNACGARAGGTGRVVVRLEAKGRTHFRFRVTDDGVGIAPENLTRIFQHGFTTRKEGHGFGLHSAALTARELGGILSAASDGPGRGATFTLELPLRPELGDKRTTKERLKIVTGRG
jgi:PAS domain S-box-containing protein